MLATVAEKSRTLNIALILSIAVTVALVMLIDYASAAPAEVTPLRSSRRPDGRADKLHADRARARVRDRLRRARSCAALLALARRQSTLCPLRLSDPCMDSVRLTNVSFFCWITSAFFCPAVPPPGRRSV